MLLVMLMLVVNHGVPWQLKLDDFRLSDSSQAVYLLAVFVSNASLGEPIRYLLLVTPLS